MFSFFNTSSLRYVLGCSDAHESLNHYALCPHMYAFQMFSFDGISDDPLISFGMIYPCAADFNLSSCLFSGHRALNSDIRAGIIRMHQDGCNQSSWSCVWSVFAHVLKVITW